MPKEVVEKISKTRRANWTLEKSLAHSAARSGKNNPMYGYKMPEEEKEKRRGKNNPYAKSILCHQNGVIYETVTQAAKELNLKQGDISNVLGNRQRTTKGYSFSYIT